MVSRVTITLADFIAAVAQTLRHGLLDPSSQELMISRYTWDALSSGPTTTPGRDKAQQIIPGASLKKNLFARPFLHLAVRSQRRASFRNDEREGCL